MYIQAETKKIELAQYEFNTIHILNGVIQPVRPQTLGQGGLKLHRIAARLNANS